MCSSDSTYSIERFGLAQARHYRDELIKTFRILSENPFLGQDCQEIKAGYRRHVHGRHVIYYRVDDSQIVILRILHERQDPLRNL